MDADGAAVQQVSKTTVTYNFMNQLTQKLPKEM